MLQITAILNSHSLKMLTHSAWDTALPPENFRKHALHPPDSRNLAWEATRNKRDSNLKEFNSIRYLRKLQELRHTLWILEKASIVDLQGKPWRSLKCTFPWSSHIVCEIVKFSCRYELRWNEISGWVDEMVETSTRWNFWTKPVTPKFSLFFAHPCHLWKIAWVYTHFRISSFRKESRSISGEDMRIFL